MRSVYIADHAWPPTVEDLAAAALAGATEVICGGAEALAQLGVETFGFHEIAPSAFEGPPPVKSVVEALLDGLVAAGKLTAPEAATAKAAAEAALAGEA